MTTASKMGFLMASLMVAKMDEYWVVMMAALMDHQKGLQKALNWA